MLVDCSVYVHVKYIMWGNARKLAKSNSGTLVQRIIARSLSGDDPKGIFCFSLWVQGGDRETAVGPLWAHGEIFQLICFYRS